MEKHTNFGCKRLFLFLLYGIVWVVWLNRLTKHGQYNQCTNWIIQCLVFTAFRYINKSLGLLTNCLNCCSRWVFGTQITNQLTSINRRGFFSILRKNTSRQCVHWNKTKKPMKFHIHCYHSNGFVLALFPSYNPQTKKGLTLSRLAICYSQGIYQIGKFNKQK